MSAPRPVWSLVLDPRSARLLGALRAIHGVEVALDRDGRIWLRGAALEDDDARRVSSLPCRDRYSVLEDEALVPAGSRVPTARWPELDWHALEPCVRVSASPAAFTARSARRAPVTLIRSSEPREADVLLTELPRLADHALATLEARLAGLLFAVSDRGRAIVRGRPLPPVRGVRLVEHGEPSEPRVAVPSGMTWAPRVDPDVLAEALGAGRGGLALWLEDGPVLHVPAEALLPLTRSAVRASLRAASASVADDSDPIDAGVSDGRS